MPRPNILYVHSHDSGRYVQPYGHAIPTPNIQHLAEEGVLFRQAFCAGPTCSPSRAALLTGMAPHNAGMIGLAHRGFSLHDYRQHLANVLKDAGYRTALAGVQHVADRPETIGYDEVLTHERPTVANVAPIAAQWLTQAPSAPMRISVTRCRHPLCPIHPRRAMIWRPLRPAPTSMTRASAPCWLHCKGAASLAIPW